MAESLHARLLGDEDNHNGIIERWESLVRDNTAGGIMQSVAWRAVKESQGVPSFHLGIFSGDELIGGAVLYTTSKKKGLGILVAPEGPILPWGDEGLARSALALIISGAKEQAREIGAIALRIEPRLLPPPSPLLREFVRGPMDLVPSETLYIDLSRSVQDILDSMKPKGRYNIKVAERHGVKISEDETSASVSAFYEVIKQASKRDEFAVEPIEFFEKLAKVLCARGMARFLFAEHEGDVLAAMLLVAFGQRATYLYGGTTNLKRNLMGGYALQWSAMQRAKDLGCTIYDFYGFDQFRSPEHQYARFSQFKSQFGGQPMKFIGAHDYFFEEQVADAFIRLVAEAGG